MKEERHVGVSSHRLVNEPVERLFAEAWQKENDEGKILRHLLNKTGRWIPSEVTVRDIEVAATVIQWLGSPVGQSFLQDIGFKFSVPLLVERTMSRPAFRQKVEVTKPQHAALEYVANQMLRSEFNPTLPLDRPGAWAGVKELRGSMAKKLLSMGLIECVAGNENSPGSSKFALTDKALGVSGIPIPSSMRIKPAKKGQDVVSRDKSVVDEKPTSEDLRALIFVRSRTAFSKKKNPKLSVHGAWDSNQWLNRRISARLLDMGMIKQVGERDLRKKYVLTKKGESVLNDMMKV